MALVLSLFLAALATPALLFASAIPEKQGTQIVGGTAAAAGEFPFIVSIQTSAGQPFCAGTLLNADTVMTAGHCSPEGSEAPLDLLIRAGSLTTASGGVTSGVSNFTIFPKYDGEDYDISILKLSTSIPTSSTIAYGRLPASDSDPAAGSITTVAGWGATREGGSSSASLLKVSVPVISRTQCQAAYAPIQSPVTDRMWCAGEAAGGKDACQGDSGGPIVDGSSTVIGIVSWGRGCARAEFPGVYTRVSSFISFINSNL